MGRTDFSDIFQKIIIRHKRIGYDLNVMRQSACLVINPITVDNFAAHFNCTLLNRASDSMIYLVGWDRSSFVCCYVHRGSTDNVLLLQISICVVWQTRDLHLSRNTLYLLSPRRCFFMIYLFIIMNN